MKQETPEESQVKKAKTSELEVLNIDFFYKKFKKEKKLYVPSLFGIKTRAVKPRALTFKEYKKIISTFLKIYFFELYMTKKTMYFFLCGFMKLTTSPTWTKLKKRGYSKEKTLHVVDKALVWFWYMRPSEKTFLMVKISKLTGLNNMIPKIEKIFNNNNDKDLLPIFTEERKKGKINKTLYRCTHP